MIQIKALSKSFGKKKVLKNINLEFQKGKVYGVVGHNGAGKTTLFNCIAGMHTYDGSIVSNFKTLKNNLGFLLTNPIFMSRITGWEYLKLLCVARDIKTDNFEAQNIFDLPLSQYAEAYSTGMKKKLALTGLLLQGNEVFILDEPFNGVDIHSNMIISELIKKLRSLEKTILISSHIFSSLKDNCDVIHLLKEGTISRTVEKENFNDLESEMKNFIVGNLVEKMEIK